MAYIENTMFETKVTNAEFDTTLNITGIFNNSSSDPEICSAGFLCVQGEQLDCTGYTGILNTNAYIMTAATSEADITTNVYACNTFNVNEITDPVTGAIYKIGANTLGLPVPAGRRATFTKIEFANNDRIYRFGAGNLSTAISSNQFFTINDGLLVPAASAPTTVGAIYFSLVGTGTATQGAYAGMTYYDVKAHYVATAA